MPARSYGNFLINMTGMAYVKMLDMKFVIPFLLLLLIISGCTPDIKPVGGPCSYENFETTAMVTGYEFTEDDLIRIHFKITPPTIGFPDGSMIHYADQNDTLFTEDKLRNPNSRYSISGKHITKGTCTPTTALQFSWTLADE